MALELRVETELSDEELATAFAIRHRVFTCEQAIPAELDRDGEDHHACHVLISSAGRGVATGRVVISPTGEAVIARIAVLPEYRGLGLGRTVVKQLEAIAEAAGARTLLLHPHHYLERFYNDLGYVAVPGTFRVAGHQLITMIKRIRHAQD